jgi:hypothetical protein
VSEHPIHLGILEIVVRDIHRSHLPCHHNPSRVKLLGNVKLRRQPKNLSKLRELDIKSSDISHPHKDPLFLVKEESRVELSNDLLVLIMPELQQICNPMEVTGFENLVEVHILLVPHIIYIYPLMTDHKRGLRVEHSQVPILMKEGPEPPISASLLR